MSFAQQHLYVDFKWFYLLKEKAFEKLFCFIAVFVAAERFLHQYFGPDFEGTSHPALTVLNQLCSAAEQIQTEVHKCSIMILKPSKGEGYT